MSEYDGGDASRIEQLQAKVDEQRAYIDLLVKAGKGSEDRAEAAEGKLKELRENVSGQADLLDDLCRMYATGTGKMRELDAAELLAEASDRLAALLDQPPQEESR